MVDKITISNVEEQRLADFLEKHDLHLLTDATDIISIGTIYRKYEDSKSRRIGYVNNFIIPEISLPDSKKGNINNIKENLRNNSSVNFIVSGVSKFISTFGFSINTEKEKIVETNYTDAKIEEIDNVTLGNLLKDHHLDTKSSQFDSNSEYYVVTRIVKSKDIKVNMKLSNDLKAALQANAGQPIVEGNVKLEYAKGKLDEVTYNYTGTDPLVFAVHLEFIEFDKANGNISKLAPLTKVIKILGDDEHYRLLESGE